ncbi:MAG: asparagine synthetase B, partial [Adlercreutzia sp.]|nr:asparagine synthetase B [Adlercreutzia sp.]
MCGFVGFIDEGSGYDRRAVIAAMAETIAHRGPDSDGFFDDGRCAFGFRRLAIIDLEGAQQPLVNEDGTLVLVFNGEIYNYRELRDQLRAAGHRFSTQGDGEVVLHGFEQWGDSLLAHLRGMFAFALYNRRTGEVFCSRDAFGIKPLYYQDQGARLLFASEIKGLLPHPRFAKELHAERLTTYLCMEYQPDDATLFKGVRKLPAGHWMRWRQGKCQVQRWFWPHYAPDG